LFGGSYEEMAVSTVIAVGLDAFRFGEPADVRFPVLASILANDRLHGRVGFQKSRVNTQLVFHRSEPPHCRSSKHG
jgi:hypothetical protein